MKAETRGKRPSWQSARKDAGPARAKPRIWNYPTANPEKWTTERIFRELSRQLDDAGLTDLLGSDAVMALADAHHLRMRANVAIRRNPDSPRLNGRDAYAARSSANAQIMAAFKSLGLYPRRPPLAIPTPGEQPGENVISISDFKVG